MAQKSKSCGPDWWGLAFQRTKIIQDTTLVFTKTLSHHDPLLLAEKFSARSAAHDSKKPVKTVSD